MLLIVGVVAPRDLLLPTLNFFLCILHVGVIHPIAILVTQYPVKFLIFFVHPITTHPVRKLASC